MKALWSWLLELCDLPTMPTVEEGARALTGGGLEIEGLTDLGAGFTGVVVAEVVAKRPHPDSDKLTLVDVITEGWAGDAGGVRRAQRARARAQGAVGAAGRDLAGRHHARDQAGQGHRLAGHAVRRGRARPRRRSRRHRRARRRRSDALGAPAQRALGIDDWLLDVNVPANRGDCLGHLGLARELAALLGGRLVQHDVGADLAELASEQAHRRRWSSWRSTTPPRARATSGGDRRRHRRPSPRRFAQRLRAVGVRPISNLVDVTNYVLFELGQPLHAFDWHRLAAPPRIGVRRPGRRAADDARRVDRALEPGDLVITDGSGRDRAGRRDGRARPPRSPPPRRACCSRARASTRARSVAPRGGSASCRRRRSGSSAASIRRWRRSPPRARRRAAGPARRRPHRDRPGRSRSRARRRGRRCRCGWRARQMLTGTRAVHRVVRGRAGAAGLHRDRRRRRALAGHAAERARRSAARGRSDRGRAARRRVRRGAGDAAAADRAAAAARRRRGRSRAARAGRRRADRGDHLRLPGAGAPRGARPARRRSPRAADRGAQPDVDRPGDHAHVARAQPARRDRAQPVVRPARRRAVRGRLGVLAGRGPAGHRRADRARRRADPRGDRAARLAAAAVRRRRAVGRLRRQGLRARAGARAGRHRRGGRRDGGRAVPAPRRRRRDHRRGRGGRPPRRGAPRRAGAVRHRPAGVPGRARPRALRRAGAGADAPGAAVPRRRRGTSRCSCPTRCRRPRSPR
jgi:hypothetical protein